MLTGLRRTFDRWFFRLVPPPKELEAERDYTLALIEAIDKLYREQLLMKAALKYDVDLTGQEGLFSEADETGHKYLTSRGRAILRKLIHEEKERRFESTARWVKLFAPLITGIAGLIGIITGLVAVLQRTK